jgi:formate hydrogenlyase subunit 4
MDLLFVYSLFGIPAAVGLAIHWLILRNRLPVLWPNWLSMVLPGPIWAGLAANLGSGKTLSNLVEGIFLGVFVATLLVAQAITVRSSPDAHFRLAATTLVLGCVAAVALSLFFPGLPE